MGFWPTRFAGYYSEMVTKGADTLFIADSDYLFCSANRGHSWLRLARIE